MARTGRVKESMAIYHVMSRSITEFDLFPSESDKERFLDTLQKYKEKYECKIYAFCLMTNHYHIIIDTCGFDISNFMKSLNQSYVKYINKKYKRRGHLLAERFNSKIINTHKYMLTASAYIHNNPKDLPEYRGKEFEYPYSSMGIYLGTQKDKRNIVETEFLLSAINESKKQNAVKYYAQMVAEYNNIGTNAILKKYLEEFRKEQYEYKSYRKIVLRDKRPDEVINIIANKLGIDDISQLMHRWKRRTMEFRRISAYVLNIYCGMGINEVAKYMHNISASCASKLCEKGFEAFRKNKEIKKLILDNL